MKHDENEHEHLVQPISTYVKVFGGLILLTAATVLTSMFDFGVMNIVIAMIIAVIKAMLVISFFMQLKFDDIGNKVTFASSFAFLAIFIILTSSDLFFRHVQKPVKVAEMAPKGETDQNKLRIATPELVAKGKALFQVQCITCHGAEGKGDGAAAAALNPKPRNFTTGYWRYGGAPTRIFHTLSYGSPGTAMAAFTALSVEERYSLAHFVRSLSPNHPDDKPEDLKAAGLAGGGKPVGMPEPEIPVEVAMEKMEEPDQVIMPSGAKMHGDSPGAKIYDQKCSQCHGLNAMGVSSMSLGTNPVVNLMTKSWSGIKAPWAASQGDFIKLVSEGIPGRGMPGMATFSKDEWNQLYAYARELTSHK